MKALYHLGNLFVLGLVILGCMAYCHGAHAEPTNAPDTKGHFVLVIGGTATWNKPGNSSLAIYRIQPFIVPGFLSFHQCRSAGMELQARLNSDGYTLDFSCIATSK